MAVVLEGTQTTSHTSGTTGLSISLPSGVAEDDCVVIIASSEASSTLSTPTGYTQLVSEMVADSFSGTDLCRMYVWWKVAGGSESNPTTASNSNTADKRFIVHRFSGTSTTAPIVSLGSGTDNSKSYPGSTPAFDIASCELSSFDKAVFRVAACNDNGDEGTWDSSQTFTGHTRRSILTGTEVGLISIQKDSVSAGSVDALTLHTISVDGGEVDGICYANLGLRVGTSTSGSNRMLMGVG